MIETVDADLLQRPLTLTDFGKFDSHCRGRRTDDQLVGASDVKHYFTKCSDIVI